MHEESLHGLGPASGLPCSRIMAHGAGRSVLEGTCQHPEPRLQYTGITVGMFAS